MQSIGTEFTMNNKVNGNKQKTVLINGRFLMQTVTGVQRYAYEVISAMGKIEKNGLKFIIAIPDCNGAGKSFDFETICDNSSLSPIIWQQIRLPVLMKKYKADLLWSPCNIGPIYNRNHVISMHDATAFAGPKWFSLMFRTYYKIMFPILGRAAIKTITVSNFSKQELIKYGITDEKKITVLPEGVNPVKFTPNGSNKLNFSYVLTVSSRDPRKNLARLIEAWEHLPSNVKQQRKLVIAGKETGSFSSEKFNGISDDVHFTGFIPDNDLVSLYSGADVFIFPSLYEGFGLPPLEAMACGCPVIASNVASIPEVCEDAAYYIDPYSTESIAEGLHKLLTDTTLRQDLIKKGLERAKLFSWERSAKEHIDVFNDILDS